MSFERINIIGPPGSGKSTLARRLANKFDLPLVHMDKIAHTDKYNPMYDKPAFRKKIRKECEKDKWIMEGVYKSTLDLRVPRADVTLYLDIPRSVYVYRVLKRRIQYHNKVREEMPEGWKEKIDPAFFKYVWNYSRDDMPLIEAELAKFPHENIVTLQSNDDINRFINQGE